MVVWRYTVRWHAIRWVGEEPVKIAVFHAKCSEWCVRSACGPGKCTAERVRWISLLQQIQTLGWCRKAATDGAIVDAHAAG